ALLGLPAARGLFHKAIPQSGACHLAFAASRASDVAARVVRKSGRRADDAAALRALSAAEVLAASPNMLAPDPELGGLAFGPVIDGKVIPLRPIETVAQGDSREVAILVGSTRDEWRLFTLMDPRSSSVDDDVLRQRVRHYLDAARVEPLLEGYSSSRLKRGEPSAPPDLLAAVETDRLFGVPALRLAEAQ